MCNLNAVCLAICAVTLGWGLDPVLGVRDTKAGPAADQSISSGAHAMPVELASPVAQDDKDDAPALNQKEYLEKMRKLGKSMNSKLSFHGQILDQNGKPVEGVKVKAELGYYGDVILPGLLPHQRNMVRVSDARGCFSLEGLQGVSLSLNMVPKEGFEFLNDGYLQVEFEDEGKAPSTQQSPHIFRVHKKQGAEALLMNSARKAVNPDGRVYGFDFKNNEFTEGKSEGAGFTILVRRPVGGRADLERPFDWAVEIAGISYELLESNDDFMYLAPVAGYLPAWSFSLKADAVNFTKRLKRNFYLKSRDGASFGRIQLKVVLDFNQNALVQIQYWVNPKRGSRNLEFDEEKRISGEDQ